MPIDELMTLAELTIALAGFSAIVVVLNKQSPAQGMAWQVFSITRGLLESCLFVIVFCFLPVVLLKFDVPDARAWALASSVHAAGFALWALLFGSLIVLGRLSRFPDGTLAALADIPMPIAISSFCGMVLASIVQSLNAAGYFDSTIGVYFTMLVAHFVLVFLSFISLFWSLMGFAERGTDS